MKNVKETYNILRADREKGIKTLYELYAEKLSAYAKYNWQLKEDVAWDLIYRSIYKVADVSGQYVFKTEEKFASFLFKVFINNIRDHLRSVKHSHESNFEIELTDKVINTYQAKDTTSAPNEALKFLQQELDKMKDWERVLLLLRGQNMPYHEIAKYVDKPESQLKVYYARLKKELETKLTERLTKKKENA
ncbi:MAG TPA: sigma-70 family RNA polymerase sigma factor [Bacteroidia bacterium]|nr:sigma-70 family RNA polymerase sigma factor [Bacteroidia bacterium]